jgi:hypothetical protein
MMEILTVSITPGEGDEIDCREKGKAALRIVDSRQARNMPLHGLKNQVLEIIQLDGPIQISP